MVVAEREGGTSAERKAADIDDNQAASNFQRRLVSKPRKIRAPAPLGLAESQSAYISPILGPGTARHAFIISCTAFPALALLHFWSTACAPSLSSCLPTATTSLSTAMRPFAYVAAFLALCARSVSAQTTTVVDA